MVAWKNRRISLQSRNAELPRENNKKKKWKATDGMAVRGKEGAF